jgi:biotin carboxyl carrier protein
MIVNRRLRRRIGLAAVSGMLMLSLSSFMPAKNEFTAAEQQQVSIATPGLFAQSQAFNVDFEIFRAKEYSFPLPVGKASLINGNSVMRISTAKGDAVKAMFDGYVRLSRKTESMGNVIVIRHDNGLETVYANNAENLVKVGQSIDAGQTIAIVGSREGETYCDFSIMVNGARINPETIIELKSHKLRRQTVQFRKEGNHIGIKVIGGKDSSVSKNDKNDRNNKETNKKSGSSLCPVIAILVLGVSLDLFGCKDLCTCRNGKHAECKCDKIFLHIIIYILSDAAKIAFFLIQTRSDDKNPWCNS